MWKSNDVAFDIETLLLFFKLNLASDEDVHYITEAKITTVMAMINSVFVSIIGVGVLASFFSKGKINEDVMDIFAMNDYKQTAMDIQ